MKAEGDDGGGGDCRYLWAAGDKSGGGRTRALAAVREVMLVVRKE